MTDEQVRSLAAFEEWAREEGYILDRDVGGALDFYEGTTGGAWQAWQAARGFWMREAARIAEANEAAILSPMGCGCHALIRAAAGDEP